MTTEASPAEIQKRMAESYWGILKQVYAKGGIKVTPENPHVIDRRGEDPPHVRIRYRMFLTVQGIIRHIDVPLTHLNSGNKWRESAARHAALSVVKIWFPSESVSLTIGKPRATKESKRLESEKPRVSRDGLG